MDWKGLRRILISTIALLVVSPASHAQDSASGLFFDTVDINVVNIEVLVTDKDGQSVKGLSRDDFELFENGQPVEITNFFAVEDQRAIGDDLATVGEQGLTPEPETRQLSLVIFVDNANIKPQTRNQIFANLRTYLEGGLAADDQVMLVSLDDQLEVVHEFTADAAILASSLGRLEKGVGKGNRIDSQIRILLREMENIPLHTNDGSGGGLILASTSPEYTESRALKTARDVRQISEQLYQRGKWTTEILGEFSDSLAGLPGRKAILYVSDGISMRPSDPLSQSWLNKFEDWALSNGRTSMVGEVSNLISLDFDLSASFDDLTERASSNRVAFYPISAKDGGMVGSHVSAEFSGGGGSSSRGVRSTDVANLDQTLRQSTLLQLAADTGGLAFTNTTNIGKLLEAVKHDFRTFYSLGYTPQKLADGEQETFRKLKVKVRGQRLSVRHMKGYKQKDPLEHLAQLTLAACHYGTVDNPLEIELDPGQHQPGEKKGQFLVPVLVKIPFSRLLLLPEEEHHSGRVSMYVVVRDPNGGLSPMRRIELPIQIPNEKILVALSQSAAYPLQLELGAGPKRISIGLRDHLARTDATINLEIDVGSDPAPAPAETTATAETASDALGSR